MEEIILEALFGELLKSDSNLFRIIQLGFAFYVIRIINKLFKEVKRINKKFDQHTKEFSKHLAEDERFQDKIEFKLNEAMK